MSDQMTAQKLDPSAEVIRAATLKTLKGQVEEADIQKFLKEATSASAPPALGATANLNIAVWGKLKCDPDKQPWKYDITVWGGPAYFGSSVGFMYTAYNTWDAFFNSVTSAHAQGIISGGGILQINWFNSSGTPVGQFNGAAGGIGLVEAGGSGRWEKK